MSGEPASGDPTAGRRALAEAMDRIADGTHAVNRLLHAGERQAALAQFYDLASLAISTQRTDLTSRGLQVQARTTEISVCRIPAQPRPGMPTAMFLPGLLTTLPMAAARAVTFADMFDIVLCELPGHGASGQVEPVSLEGFAAEYAALIEGSMPRASGLTVIGESIGGLIALVLARLLPDRIRNVILIDTPFHLTSPILAATISQAWRANGSRPYHARICQSVMGFDPQADADTAGAMRHDLVQGLPATCVMIAGGSDPPPPGIASVVTDRDLAALREAHPGIIIPPRISASGHSVLLDNPMAVIATLRRLASTAG